MDDALSSLLKSILEGTASQDEMLKEWQLQQVVSKLEAMVSGGRVFSKKEAKGIIRGVLTNRSSSEEESYETIRGMLRTFPPRERADLFFEFVDPLLKNSALYWKLIRFVLSESNASKRHFPQIRKSFARYGRLQGSAHDRIVSSSIIDDSSDDDSPMQEALGIYYTLPNVVPVYRGFIVSGNSRVRRSPDKNSPKYFQQNEGSGFAYSLEEEIAVTFAARAAHNYADKSSKMRTKGMTKLTDFQKCFEHFYRGGHPYVGSYSVPKEKIILIVTEMGEKEIIAQPEDVRLESYRVLHAKDIYERFVKICPDDFPIPDDVKWDPNEFRDSWRQWHKPNMD
jgi:hypothetical protein